MQLFTITLRGTTPDAGNTPVTASKITPKIFPAVTFWKAPNAGISRLGSPTCLYLQKLENKQIPNMLLQARRMIVASEFIESVTWFFFKWKPGIYSKIYGSTSSVRFQTHFIKL